VTAQYEEASKQRESLAQESSRLLEEAETSKKAIVDLEEKLVQASSSFATHTRQMQVLQNELKSAIKRAEESEKTTRNLQLEGTNLMRSLDEMRPKIVELTDTKLDLSDKVDSLQRAVSERDRTIAKLEASLEEVQHEHGEAGSQLQQLLSQRDKEYATLQKNFDELQKGYGDLQEELETTLASLKSVEAQRASHHQDTSRRLEEIDRLTSSNQNQAEEISTLRHELEARQIAQVCHYGYAIFTNVKLETYSILTGGRANLAGECAE
jgi:chromosome segregation ATPase